MKTSFKIIEKAVAYAKKHSDKAVLKVLTEVAKNSETSENNEASKASEKLLWSGQPGYVATFSGREIISAIPITAIISITAAIVFNSGDLPVEFYLMLAALGSIIIMLFMAWVRQIYRYTKTFGVFYAVTDKRVIAIRKKKIAKELPLTSIKNIATYRKSWGNGTIVFNEGEDFFEKGNVLEAPTEKIFAFFNVMDLDGVVKLTKPKPASKR